MERRARGRIRDGSLTAYQVILADDAHLSGRLVDISESGLQLAVECPLLRRGEHGRPVLCDCGATDGRLHFPVGREVMPGVLLGAHLEHGFAFHGHIVWTRRDPERNRMFAGFRFTSPKELPVSFHLIGMGEPEDQMFSLSV